MRLKLFVPMHSSKIRVAYFTGARIMRQERGVGRIIRKFSSVDVGSADVLPKIGHQSWDRNGQEKWATARGKNFIHVECGF